MQITNSKGPVFLLHLNIKHLSVIRKAYITVHRLIVI